MKWLSNAVGSQRNKLAQDQDKIVSTAKWRQKVQISKIVYLFYFFTFQKLGSDLFQFHSDFWTVCKSWEFVVLITVEVNLWAYCLDKMWELQCPTILCAFTACYRDSLTFQIYLTKFNEIRWKLLMFVKSLFTPGTFLSLEIRYPSCNNNDCGELEFYMRMALIDNYILQVRSSAFNKFIASLKCHYVLNKLS